MKLNFYILIFGLTFLSANMTAQDTIRYFGTINGKLLYESIELYPDNTFKWVSEYDLSWSEYGIYKKNSDSLILKYYTINDKIDIDKFAKPSKKEIFLRANDGLYRLDDKGRKIKKRKDKSINTRWGWLFGYKYKYKIVKSN